MNIFFSILNALIYGLTCYRFLLKSQVTAIYRHPLFFYTVIVLALMIISFRMEGKSKTIMLAFSFILLLLYYISLVFAPSTFGSI